VSDPDCCVVVVVLCVEFKHTAYSVHTCVMLYVGWLVFIGLHRCCGRKAVQAYIMRAHNT
jgi:hypothetical protein